MHQRIAINLNNLLYISSSKIEDGFLTSLHSHPNMELLLFIKGKGQIVTTNRKIEVKEKDIVIINPNSKHCEIGEGLAFLAIGLRDINIYLKETFTKKIIVKSLTSEDYTKIRNIYQLIYQEAEINDESSKKILNNSYEIIYNLLNRNYAISSNDSSNDIDLVSNIKNIIENYYSSDIKLDDIAHRLSQSKSSICHVFKKETGMTIIEYKIEKELEEAANLLKISDMNISDISSLVGFNHTSYFIKSFKKKYGCSPKEYKAKFNN